MPSKFYSILFFCLNMLKDKKQVSTESVQCDIILAIFEIIEYIFYF